jgi:hypothetical protein
LIFQDEISQIISNSNGNGKDESEDIALEFQKFMDGEYINRGNYIFLAATNVYEGLPLAIRSRFDPPLSWDGAATPEQKAILFQYKLEEGVKGGYVTIEESNFNKLGQMAYEANIPGRGINTICTNLKRSSIIANKKGEVWKAKGNYAKQLELIDNFRVKIDYHMAKKELLSFAENQMKSKSNSKIYEAA